MWLKTFTSLSNLHTRVVTKRIRDGGRLTYVNWAVETCEWRCRRETWSAAVTDADVRNQWWAAADAVQWSHCWWGCAAGEMRLSLTCQSHQPSTQQHFVISTAIGDTFIQPISVQLACCFRVVLIVYINFSTSIFRGYKCQKCSGKHCVVLELDYRNVTSQRRTDASDQQLPKS